MLTREIVQSGHKTSFTITRDGAGWAVCEERDETIVKQAHYSDWHRVERALQQFELSKTPDPTGR
jgi:hypothetical protein